MYTFTLNRLGLGCLGALLLLSWLTSSWTLRLLLVAVPALVYALVQDKPRRAVVTRAATAAAAGDAEAEAVLDQERLDDELAFSERALLKNKWAPRKLRGDYDVVVIGSGMSGLSTAAIMARLGSRVLVLEQHDIAGGCTHDFNLGSREDAYAFDSGLHYTVPWSGPLLELACGHHDVPAFDRLGSPVDNVFDTIVLEPQTAAGTMPATKPDGTWSFGVQHREGHMAELYKMFPKEHDAIKKYIALSDKALLGIKLFLLRRLVPLWAQSLYNKYLLEPTFNMASRRTGVEAIKDITSDPKLQSILCGLWINASARPDKTTFTLTAAVFRGLSLETGCYPRGGPSEMTKVLVNTVLANDGRVFVEASVKEIVCDPTTNRATAVRLADGTIIKAKTIISSVGYANTFGKLVPREIGNAVGMPPAVPGLGQSEGFIMLNVGMRGTAEELGLKGDNIWIHPVNPVTGDMFDYVTKFYDSADPLADDMPAPPIMLTFPSLKNKDWPYPDRQCVQILCLAPFSWFAKYESEPCGKRSAEYQELKKRWTDRILATVFRHYPHFERAINFTDTSSPLSISFYLNASGGGAVGLEHTPRRYTDQTAVALLDPRTRVPGLYLTGHDTTMCGVALAQIAGVLTALVAGGPVDAARFVAKTAFCM